MKTLSTSRALVSLSVRSALILSISILANPLAVEAQQLPSSAVAQKRIEAIESDLLNIADKAQRLSTQESISKNLTAAKTRIETASDEELAALYQDAGPYISYFSNLVDRYAASLDELYTYTQKSGSFPVAPYPAGSRAATFGGIFEGFLPDISDLEGEAMSLVDHVFSVVCSDAGNAQTERLSYQSRFTAKQAILVGELIRDILGRVCDQEFYVLGAGGDSSLACIASDLIYQFARPLEEFPAICDALIDSAEIEGSYERLGHLHGDLETAQTSLNDLDGDLVTHDAALDTHDDDIFNALDGSATVVVNTVGAATVNILSSLSTHDSDIKDVLAANRAFFLRTFIERSLFREIGNGSSTPPSTVYRLATLYLPATYGGNLELVRDIVAGSISNVTAAGEDANGAADLLADADQAVAAGSYKEAWDLYADAYVEAMRCPRSNPACR